MTETPTVIEYVLERLWDIGVTDIFGVPGDFAFPINDAIVAHPKIDWIGSCNELNAAYAADGYARIRGVGAFATTYGVGELGAISAVAGSYAERVPVFHLTGMPSLTTRAKRALVHHTLGNGEFGLFHSMADRVVGASAILTPANATSETERLIAEARYNRLPVYMAIPVDVANEPILAKSDSLALPVSNPISLMAAADSVSTALATAETAVVLPGIVLDRFGISDEALRFIEAAGLPFATMFSAKAVYDEDHPNYIGMYSGKLMNEQVDRVIEEAEIVISIGALQTDLNTGSFTASLDPARTIDIGFHVTKVGPTVYPNVEMGDLLNELAGRTFKPRQLPAVYPTSLSPNIDSDSGRITADALYPRWANFLRENDILIAETGTCSMGMAFAKLPHGMRFHNQTLWGAIGWATPAAFGAALAAPGRRLVLITGEGAHQLTAQEICQFHRYGLKPIIFVLNNSGYLIERLLCEDPDVSYNDLPQWNYSELPHALGCQDWYTMRVSTIRELDDALEIASRGEQACYVEVITGAYEAPPLAKKMHDCVKFRSQHL